MVTHIEHIPICVWPQFLYRLRLIQREEAMRWIHSSVTKENSNSIIDNNWLIYGQCVHWKIFCQYIGEGIDGAEKCSSITLQGVFPYNFFVSRSYWIVGHWVGVGLDDPHAKLIFQTRGSTKYFSRFCQSKFWKEKMFIKI